MRQTAIYTLKLLAELAAFEIHGDDFFFLRLLAAAQMFQMLSQFADALFRFGQLPLGSRQFGLPGLHQGGNLTQLTLEGKWTSAAFLASADRAAVIVDAVGG